MESDILSKGASYSGHRFNHHCQLIWEFWLAGLLRILSTVLSIPYPSGSPSDCYYKCSCISVLYFLKPMTDSQKWPPGTFDAHSLPISITLLPSFFPHSSASLSAMFSPPFHIPLLFHRCSFIPPGNRNRLQQCWQYDRVRSLHWSLGLN